jgi:F-type H+-transporting ATPase subunit delta
MKSVRVARRYATALMSAAEEMGSVDAVSADVELLGRVLRDSRELRMLLASPVITPAKKTAVLTEIFGGKVGTEAFTFIMLLIQKGREGILADMVEQFARLRDAKLGIIDVGVRSAVPLEKSQEKALADQIEHYTRKRVRMHPGVDASLKGGLVIQIGDHVLDGSAANQLKLLRKRFVAGTSLS